MTAEVLASVHAALDVVNEELPPKERLEKAPETLLTGPAGGLDSLALLNFVTFVENELERRLGVTLSLYEDSLPTGTENPFQSVAHLTRHIERLLTRQAA